MLVQALDFGYPTVSAWVGLPFRSEPVLSDGEPVRVHGAIAYAYSADALPPGLAIDPGTGVISGAPTEIVGRRSVRVEMAWTDADGASYGTTAWVSLYVGAPGAVDYEPAFVVGSVVVRPTIVNYTGDPLAGIRYDFSPMDGLTLLPDGYSLDPATGEISGVVTAPPGSVETAAVAITVTFNGVTFVLQTQAMFGPP